MSLKQFDTDTALLLLGSTDEFPVDFDRAWKWLGYGKKSDAKEALFNKGFIVGVDLRIDPQSDNHASLSPQEKAAKARKEQIQLTIDCFKTWGMMANTLQGKEVRRYFLECEKIAKQKSVQPQITAEPTTKALPLPEPTLRSRIVFAVDDYVFLFGLKHQQVWTAIYRKLDRTFNYNVKARLNSANVKGRSKLEQIEIDNKIEELRSVAQVVLGAEI
jgi:hypothetical protein